MRVNSSFRCFLGTGFLLIVAFCLAIPRIALPQIQIQNPQNDPDLELAMKYDYLGKSMLERQNTSRELAEKHYLKYLERATDSQQKARIYFKLGYMFSTGTRKDKGEAPDHKKAIKYFEEVLKEQPNGISRETLFARTHMASLGNDVDDRFRQQIDIYKYLRQLDAKVIQKNIMVADLPSERKVATREISRKAGENGGEVIIGVTVESDPEVLKKERVRNLTELAKAVTESERTNTLFSALSSTAPKKNLELLIQAFPQDPIAELASEKLRELKEKLVADAAEASARKKSRPRAGQVLSPAAPAVVAPAIVAPAPAEDVRGNRMVLWIAVAAAAVIAVLLLYIFVLRRRGKETIKYFTPK